ncbi:MAG: alpha/beta fold hydrolase [Sandaracinaceae bacterium]
MTPDEHIRAHEGVGRRVSVEGVETFVRAEGEGEPALLLHGVPVSSFLWRKVLPELAGRGLQGIAFDLPGLGLADRPERFDYTWTGLGAYAIGLIEVLDLRRVHLVVHDIGGPVGFEVAAARPDRIASMTILNTVVEVAGFRQPPVMRPFALPGVGSIYLSAMLVPLFVQLMYLQGVSSRDACSPEELRAHHALLFRGDGGRAFLRIMRGFEPTEAKQARYVAAVRDAPYPVQALWGAKDPALRIDVHGEVVRRMLAPERFAQVPAKHFLQETHASEIAERVARLARGEG